MIKSQDDLNTCNEGKRKSDVLIATIEKCEKLEEKLNIAHAAISNVQLWLSGFYEVLNNNCSRHNKSIPIGNFEDAFKTKAILLSEALEKIKE